MRRTLYMSLLTVVVGGCDGASELPERSVPADTIAIEQVARIGGLDDAPEYLFGDITSVAASPSGTIYVADRIGSTVRAYDRSGTFLGTVGSTGEGPGEFQWPNDITFDPNGALYVRDRTRLTIFRAGAGMSFADSLIRTIPLGDNASPWSARGKTDGSRYFRPDYLYRNGQRVRYFYLVLDSSGPTGDTVYVPPLPNLDFLSRASYLITDRLGRNVEGINRAPFEPAASWDITSDGTIVASPGDRYEIVEWGANGDTLQLFRGAANQRRVPEGEARDSARAFQARLDSVPVPLDQVRGMSNAARRSDLPDFLPSIIAVHIGQDGNIWLRHWPPAGAGHQSYFDVFDEAGVPLWTVHLSSNLLSDPPPWVSPRIVVGVTKDPRTGVERVAVFRMP